MLKSSGSSCLISGPIVKNGRGLCALLAALPRLLVVGGSAGRYSCHRHAGLGCVRSVGRARGALAQSRPPLPPVEACSGSLGLAGSLVAAHRRRGGLVKNRPPRFASRRPIHHTMRRRLRLLGEKTFGSEERSFQNQIWYRSGASQRSAVAGASVQLGQPKLALRQEGGSQQLHHAPRPRRLTAVSGRRGNSVHQI